MIFDRSQDNIIWVEKYRPRSLEEMVLPEDYKKIFEKYIQAKEIPNVLFVGRPGSGKTTLARILVDHILEDPMDLFYFNGSSQRGINVIRDQVEEFLKTSALSSNIKIVFIDEFDYMTPDAQAALRNIIESYTHTGRFLLTANFESKILDALLSRLQVFRFKALPKDLILSYCCQILDSEEVSYNAKDIQTVVNFYYPDVRRIVGIIQSSVVNGALKINKTDLKSKELHLISFLYDIINSIRNGDLNVLSKKISDTQDLLLESSDELDFHTLYEKIGFDLNLPLPVRMIASQYYDKHMTCASPIMNYMAMLAKIIQILSEEKKAMLT